jgi:hypothetical protein
MPCSADMTYKKIQKHIKVEYMKDKNKKNILLDTKHREKIRKHKIRVTDGFDVIF